MLLRMNFFSFFFIFCLVVPSLSLGAPESKPEETQVGFRDDYLRGTPMIKAATGLAPIQFVVDRIGGEFVDSISLVAGGYDPHLFEPKMSQLTLFNQADIYFSLNSPLEQVWLERITAVNTGLVVVDLTANFVDLAQQRRNRHGGEDHVHEPAHRHDEKEHEVVSPEALVFEEADKIGKKDEAFSAAPPRYDDFEPPVDPAIGESEEYALTNTTEIKEHDEHFASKYPVYNANDPHIWLSPYFLKKVATVVAEEFSKQRPKKSAYFQKNLASFNARIDSLEERLRKEFNKLSESQKIFLVVHPSWTYFAEDFGLTQISVQKDGKEPTPATLAMVIDDARSHGISVVFVQKEFNPTLASTVAAHLPGGRVVVLNPVSYNCMKSIENTGYAIIGKTPPQVQTLGE